MLNDFIRFHDEKVIEKRGDQELLTGFPGSRGLLFLEGAAYWPHCFKSFQG
jgi:hypothetical protein